MGVLSDSEILKQMEEGNITITPFDRAQLGGNSYDLRLGHQLGVYDSEILDARKANPLKLFDIPEEGFVLKPGVLYLGSTMEHTDTKIHLPYIDGKSSLGRLGVSAHITAGRGDVGFSGYWTLEITTVNPVRVYAGMPFAQITYHEVVGEVLSPYNKKPGAKYANQPDKPVGSMMHKNDF